MYNSKDNEIRNLKERIASLEQENNRLRRDYCTALHKLHKEQEYIEDEVRSNKQEYCNHDWGPRNWIHSCFYTCTCVKCGKVEEFYERD